MLGVDILRNTTMASRCGHDLADLAVMEMVVNPPVAANNSLRAEPNRAKPRGRSISRPNIRKRFGQSGVATMIFATRCWRFHGLYAFQNCAPRSFERGGPSP